VQYHLLCGCVLGRVGDGAVDMCLMQGCYVKHAGSCGCYICDIQLAVLTAAKRPWGTALALCSE